ncbi:MAG: ChaN family lipoprotein [Nitrospirae bacterium]|nr:ChaN family lipoprotein [Nitrospirota bacterium]
MGHTPQATSWKAGDIIDTHAKQIVTFDHLKPRLLEAHVIYIGEEHYNPHHIQAAIQMLEVIRDTGKRPGIAMEMFGWDGQHALDQYIQETLSDKSQFLVDVHWEANWGGNFADYEPLVNYAKTHRLPLYGMNPPRTLVRKVVTQGLSATRQDPERIQWGFEKAISLEDPEYHRVLFRQLEECHPGMPEKMYTRYYEASIFRDEGMAKILVDALNKQAGTDGPVVSYTGGGHIQYHVPVPSRVLRDQGSSLKSLSVYLNSFDPDRLEEIDQAIDEQIADYIWLTPFGPGGPQPRCG